ncbi:MAG: hypothetical protein K2O04_02175 [Clostridiales bacterium]|nr:hypothetical protein [Clostridiales bacterium]
MNDERTQRVSGKQVLFDAVTLFKDVGAYIYELSKTAVVKIKNIIATANADDNKDGEKVNDIAKSE